MKSKMSFFNKGIILSNIKRHSWASAIWSILLFLAMPLTLMNYNLSTKSAIHLQNLINNGYNTLLNRFGGIYSSLMICIFPVLLGMLVFRYLHTQNSATVFHGLPFTRFRLFANALLSGFILMLIPFILNTLIMLIIKSTMQIGNYIAYSTIFLWLLNSLCSAFCVFSLTVFVGMFTGNIIAHIVLTYIIHFLPTVLWISIVEIFDAFIYGYPYPTMPDFLQKFPMIQIFNNTSDCNVIYIITGIVLLALAYLLYRKRPLETAGDIICFKFIRPIFKYGVTFCGAIFGYVIFADVSGDTQKNIIALTFLVIGYAISQMLLSKTWRIWKSWKGLALSIIVLCICWGALEFDVTGYEKRIPPVDEIASIEIEGALPGMDENGIEITNPDEIVLIHSMHKNLIENDEYKHDNSSFTGEPIRMDTLSFKYLLDNNKIIRRSYRYIISDYEEFIEPLFYSENIRKQGMSILRLDTDTVDKIEIYPHNSVKIDSNYITEKEKIKEFLEIYISDINKKSFDDMVYTKGVDMYAGITLETSKNKLITLNPTHLKTQNEDLSVQVHRSYQVLRSDTKTIEWIQKNLNK